MMVVLALASARPVVAQDPERLAAEGAYEAAYAAARELDTAPMLVLAARAATDQVVYALVPAGASLDEQLPWLRRAVDAAERAAERDPNAPQAWVQLARARGEIARRTGVLRNLDTAPALKALFDRALGLDPQEPDALVGLAMWHLELVQHGVGWLYGAKREAILPLLERGVAAAPDRINLRVEYATALRALGFEEAARAQLEIALALPVLRASDAVEQGRARSMLGP